LCDIPSYYLSHSDQNVSFPGKTSAVVTKNRKDKELVVLGDDEDAENRSPNVSPKKATDNKSRSGEKKPLDDAAGDQRKDSKEDPKEDPKKDPKKADTKSRISGDATTTGEKKSLDVAAGDQRKGKI
jgi:hypothetical protein